MLLRQFTKVVAAVAVLGLAGCASGPGSVDAPVRDDRQDASRAQGIPADIPARALTLYEQAVASMAAGDAVDAELRFQEFLLQYPSYPGAYVNLAIIFADRGDNAAVEQVLDRALEIAPRHPVVLNHVGMMLRRAGKFEEAVTAYTGAVTENPDYALAHYNLGVLNDLYLQRLDVALRHYERFQELAGEDRQVSIWIADLKRRVNAAQSAANVTE